MRWESTPGDVAPPPLNRRRPAAVAPSHRRPHRLWSPTRRDRGRRDTPAS